MYIRVRQLIKNYIMKQLLLIICVFLLLSFLFVVRPLVRWLTATPAGGGEMLKQLPMTVEEIERGYGEGTYSLPFRDKAKNMLLGEDEASLTIAKEWLSE